MSTWVGTYEPDLPFAKTQVKYITAVYWAVETLTTVGFGDYAPQGPTEKFVLLIIMLFNMGITAYILGNVTLLATKQDSVTAQYAGPGWGDID